MEKIVYDDSKTNSVTAAILDACIKVHKQMGPGLLESVYQHCLVAELRSRSLHVSTNVPVQLQYDGRPLNKEYVIDLLVDDEVIVELKAVDALTPLHAAQLLSYMKLAGKPFGILVNFHVPVLKDGFKRYVLRPVYK